MNIIKIYNKVYAGSLFLSDLLAEMFKDANFFLCLFVKPFFIANNLQSDICTQFVIEDFHNLVHNQAPTLPHNNVITATQISQIIVNSCLNNYITNYGIYAMHELIGCNFTVNVTYAVPL